ncbi:MAG: hypothetical protein C0483_00425 [Pirellula sp.]|nr:hypothetical protein [Pirellula sp.]
MIDRKSRHPGPWRATKAEIETMLKVTSRVVCDGANSQFSKHRGAAIDALRWCAGRRSVGRIFRGTAVHGLIIALIVGGTPGFSQAANYTWQVDAPTAGWNVDGNWTTAGFPNALGDVANLTNNITGDQVVSLNQAITLGALNVGDSDGSHSFTIAGGGGSLILDAISGTASIRKASGANALDTISANILFNDPLTITNNSTGTLALSGILTSASSSTPLTFLGGGKFLLSGANNISGAVALRGGITSISAANNLGDGSATNTLTLAGGTLQATNSFSLGVNQGPIIGLGDAVIDVTGANNLTLNGALSVDPALAGNVLLTKTGPGTLTLTGTNNTAAIATAVNGGVVSIGAVTNLGAGRLTLNGGTLQYTGSAGSLANGINLAAGGGTIDVTTSGQKLTATALVTGPGSLTKVGAGTLQIGATGAVSNYSGSTTVGGGVLAGGIDSFLPAGTQVAVNSGGTLDLNAFNVTVASVSGAGIITNSGATKVLTLGNTFGSSDTTFSGSFNGTFTLVKTAGGTLTIASSTPGTATGAWTLNAGTVNLDYTANGSASGNLLNSRDMTLSGGTLKVTGRSGATVAQSLGNITVGARGGQIVLVPGGGTSTTLTLGTLTHVTTAGASLLINAPTGTAVKTTTNTSGAIFGGRYVFTSDGAHYDWAVSSGSTPFTIGGLASGNYVPFATAAATDNAQLTGSGLLAAAGTLNTLKITADAAGQSLDLGTFNLALTAGGLLFNGANDYTIANGTLKSNLIAAAGTNDLIIHQYGTGALSIGAGIVDGTAGPSSLTKAGSGTLILSAAANDFTGGVFINAGTLSISNNSQLGGAPGSTIITMNDGATLKTTADVTTSSPSAAGSHTFSLTGGNASFDIAPSTVFTINSTISGAGGLTLNNTGTLYLGAAATYSGPTFVGAGATLTGSVATFLNSSGGGNLDVALGGTVDMNNNAVTVGGLSGAGSIINSNATAARVLTVGGNNLSTIFSGVIGGGANTALTKNGSGALTLSSQNTYTGATLLNYGTIKFGVDNALAATAITLMNAQSSGIVPTLLDLDGHKWTSAGITFYGTGSTSVSQASINIGAGGTLTLGGGVTATVSTTPANGFQAGFITGGTLDLGTAARTFSIADSINAAVDLTITSAITSAGGTFGISKTGTGTLLLTGANTYTGTTTVNGGVLALGGTGTLGATTAALTMTTGTLELNGTNQSVGLLNGAAAGTIRNSIAGTVSTLSIGNGTTAATNAAYAGTLVDNGGILALVKNGAGVISLTGTNTYSGGTQVNEGVLTFGTTASQSASGTTQVAAGAALGLGVGGTGFYSSTDVDALFANTLANVNLAAGASVGIDTTAGDFTYATNQNAARGLVKLGTNVLTLGGINGYTGGTTIMGGTLAISSDANLGAASGGLTMFAGSTLRVTGTDMPISNRTLTLAGASTFEIADIANKYTINSPSITAGGSITKIGPGVLNVNADINLNGNVLVVNNGVLAVTRAITGAATNSYTVGNTALAAGNGGGAIVLSGAGSLGYTGADASDVIRIGNAAGGFGSLTVGSGTTVTSTRWRVGMAGTGIANILTGGTVTLANYNIGGSTTTGVGTLNIAGGTLNGTMSTGNGAWSGARYEQNIGVDLGDGNSGGTLDMSASSGNFGIVQNNGAGVGIVNLITGGTLKLKTSVVPVTITTGRAELNFHGGTIEYTGTAANGNFIQTGVTAVNIWSEGAIINSGGQNLTIPAPLLAPAGNGLAGISASGSGYFTAPYVQISGGGGNNDATAVATIDANGNITGIIITNPGTGYTSAPVVTLIGGTNGASGTATANLNSGNVSGGLTKTGAGTLTLSGTNTYTGATIVNGGTISVGATTIANTSSLLIGGAGDGAFDLYQDGVGAPFNMTADAGIVLGGASTSGGLGFQLGTVSDSIVLSGTGGLIINAGGGFINATALSGFGVGNYDIITGASSITGFSNLKIGTLPGGYVYSLSSSSGKVTLGVSAVPTADLYWTGDVGSSWNSTAGGNTNWSTTANGLTDPGYSPGAASTVFFSATNFGAANPTTTLDSAFSIQGLKFLSTGATAAAIAAGTGGSLTVGSGGIEVQTGGPATTTISAPLAFGAAQTWKVASGSSLLISGALSGGVANSTQAAPGLNTTLTIQGGGTVALSNSGNTFTGDILVDASTIAVSNDRSWGGATIISSTSHTITLINGATLSLASGTVNPGAATTVNYNLIQIGAGNGNFDIASGAILQLDDPGQLYGSGNLTKNGLGTLILRSQQSTFGGNLVIAAGLLQMSGPTGGFGNTTGTTTINSGAALNLNGQSTTELENLTISGTGLAASPAGAITNSAGTATFAGPITLAADSTIGTGATSSGTMTLSGGITGPFNLTVNNLGAFGTIFTTASVNNGGTITNSGTGTGATTISSVIGANVTSVIQDSATSQLVMGGVANLFSGGLIIRAGVVQGGSHANTFGTDANVITLGASSGSADTTLSTTSSQTYKQAINVASGNTGVATIIAGTSTGSIVFSGPVTLNNHDVVLGKTGTTGTSQFTGGFTGTGNITINNTVTSTGVINLATGVVNNTGTITNSGSATGSTTISAPIGANVTGVIQNNASTLVLSGINSAFVGAVTVSNGILQVSGASALNAFNTVTIASTGTLNVNQSFTIAGLNSIAGATVTNTSATARVLTLGGTGNYTFAGNLIANTPANLSLTVALAAGGTQTLTGSNTYTGATSVNRGTLILDFAQASVLTNILSASSSLVFGGGTLSIVGNAAASSQSFTTSSTAGGSYSTLNAVAGAGGLTVDLGTMTRNVNSALNVTTTNNPAITVSGLSVANGIAVGSNGVAFLTIDSTNWGTISGGNITDFTSYQNDDFTAAANNVNVTTSANWTGTTVNTLRFAAGSPTLTLSGTNALGAGGLLITAGAGAVTIGGTGSLAGSAAGGTVAAPVVGELGIFQNSNSVLTISTPILNNASGLSYVSAAPSGNTLNKYGTGTLVLSSNKNAYTGGTNIASGMLQLGAAEALPDGFAALGGLTIHADGTLDLNGLSETVNGLSGSGVVDNTSATAAVLYVGNANASSTFSGVIQNTGGASSLSLTKVGTGTLTLSGANTYGGTTTINGGGLTLNFTAPGAPLTNIIKPSSALNIGTATLTVTGSVVANSQTFASTTIGGSSRVTQSGTTPNLTVNLGAISRVAGSGGTLNVTLVSPGVVTTTNTNDATGILGAWAVVNSADFATVNASNQIVAYTGYTAFAGATGAGSTTQNARFDAGNSVSAATVDFNTVKLGTTSIAFAAATNILRLGAVGSILMPTGTGTSTIGSAANNGILTAGGTVANAAGELNVINWSASTLTINSTIANNGAGAVTLVKSGSGALTLAGTNTYSGGTIINQGTLTASNANQLGSGGITLNGGQLTFSADSGLALGITLGAGGGTLNWSGISGGDRTFGASGNIGVTGVGPRVLTFNGGGSDRRAIFVSNIIDGSGGATSVVLNFGADNRNLRLTGANTYTGTTTITRGILDFTAVTGIAGGISSAATVGNILFNATGANRAILQSSLGTQVALTRSLGYGDGQIHWEGNGGFSNNSAGTTWAVNLGGAGATLVWGQGGFVPNGSILQFGATSIANSVNGIGAVDFQNGIHLGDTLRTIEAGSANDKLGNTPYDVILSGNLTSSAGGGINKTGAGVLILGGVNNLSTTTSVTVSAGALIFKNLAAIPGTGANITLSETPGGNSAFGLDGDTNPLASLGARIANPLNATAAFTLGADSNVDFDFSAYPKMRLAAYAFTLPTKAITYTGTITPANSTYMFGGTPYASDATNTLATTLVLANRNALTGVNALNMSYGNLTLLSSNNYTGGTTIDGNAVGNPVVGVGSNAAFGTGDILLSGNQTRALGAVNGDRYVANNISFAGTAQSIVLGGDSGNDGVSNTANGGGLTYLGTITISSSHSAPAIVGRTSHQILLLGNITNPALTTGLTFGVSTNSLTSLLATAANGGVAKTYTGTSILNDGTVLVIDDDSALGVATNGVRLGSGTSTAANLRVQPGTAAVVLNASRTVTLRTDSSQIIQVGRGSTLTIAGVLAGGSTNTGARTFSKFDAGTLVLQNKSTYAGAATNSNSIALRGGALRLDSSSGAFTATTDRFFADAANPLAIAFSAATGTFAGGATLEIVQAATNAFALTQGFGNLTFNTGANVIKLTNNSATQALTLNLGSTFTRATLIGATVNFVTNSAGGVNTIGSAIANANGIIGGYATFNGVDWATQSGGAIIALPSGSYTTLAAASNSATTNFVLSSGTVALTAAGGSVNSLKLVGSAGAGTNVTLNGTLTVTSRGILFDNTLGNASISGGTQLGANGSEIIVHTSGSGDITTNKLTLNGVIKGTSTVLTKSGSGTLVLAGANNYTGSLIINEGVLEYANGSVAGQNLGSPTAGATNILLNGGVLRQTTTNNLIYGITVNGYAAFDVQNGVTVTQSAQGITGKVGVAGILQKTGVGTLTFSGTTDNPSLSLEVVAGTVNLGKTSTAAVHSVGVAAGNAAASTMGAALLIGANGTVNITGTGGDQIHDQSSVVVRANGVLNLGGGTATAESFDSLAGTGSVTNNNLNGTFTLTLGAGNNVNVSAYSVAAADAGVASTGLNNFGGVISDGGAGKLVALTKIGGGIQILSGQNTYSGTTSINAGTLQLGVANALPFGVGKGDVNIIGNGYGAGTINGGTSIGSANLILAPGTLDMGGFDQQINGLNSSTGGYVLNNPTVAWNGSAWVAANATNLLTLGNGDAAGSYNGTLANGYSVAPGATTAQAYTGILRLAKVGGGTQALIGKNISYTGATTISGGILRLTDTTAFQSDVTNNAALDLNATTGAWTMANNISGSGVVNKLGSGTVFLTSLNSYTGATTISDGVLSVTTLADGGTASGIGAALSLADNLVFDGGTLRYTGSSVAINRNFKINAGKTAVIDVATAGTVLSISGTSAATNGNFTKSGFGTLSLGSGVYGHSGTTIVSSGTLNAANGATLTGGLTVQQNATFSPGTNSNGTNNNGVGAITTGNVTTFDASSNLIFDFQGASANLSGTDVSPGTNWDYLSTGTINLSLAGGKINLYIDSWNGTAGYGQNSGANPFDPSSVTSLASNVGQHGSDGRLYAYTWKWMTASSGVQVDGINTSTTSEVDLSQYFNIVTGLNGDATYGTGVGSSYGSALGGQFWVSAYNNELYVNYSAVPEPGSLLLIGMAGLGFAGYRRRKKIREQAAEQAPSATAEEAVS